MKIKDYTFGLFAVFDKIEGLQDNEGYLLSKHKLRKFVKMIEL